MRLGNKIYLILISYFFLTNSLLLEEKISSTPLINIENIKPSFEELIEENETISNVENLK